MRATILNLMLLLLNPCAFGQTQLLKGYDFNKGGYYILGTFAESDRNTLRDSLGEFYTDDIAILNKFKTDWTFKKQGKRYACGYHYSILVCKQGQVLGSFLINLNCKEIVSDRGYFYFNPNLLRQFYGKLKKPYSQRQSFKSITEARSYRKNILKDPTLIMAPNPEWSEFEGKFRFTYKCKTGTKECLDEEEKVLKSVKAEIARKYPNEKFVLANVGGSQTTVEFEVMCNKSLSDKFGLYYRDNESYFGTWQPFDLTLQTYWTAKQK